MNHSTITKTLTALTCACALSSCTTPAEKESLFSCIDKQEEMGTQHTLLYKYNKAERKITLVSVDGDLSTGGSVIAADTEEANGKITWKNNNPEFGESISTIDTKSMEWKTTTAGQSLSWKCTLEKPNP